MNIQINRDSNAMLFQEFYMSFTCPPRAPRSNIKSWLRASQEWARLALIMVVMSSYVARESGVTLALHTNPIYFLFGRKQIDIRLIFIPFFSF